MKKMKLPVFLLVLLAPSFASLQDALKSSQHTNVSILNQDLEDKIPEIISNRTILTRRFLSSSAILRQKRQAHPPNLHYESPSLKWLSWTGTLPKGSVSIYNEYVNRVDYVCKYKCQAGFYSPNMGSYCYYPYENKELKSNRFEILVNKDNFEILEWKKGSYGSVPQNSVKTCSKGDIYIGRNTYGLGKVHVKHKAFYLPWKGSEYWYQKSYDVLTYDVDVYSEHISNIKYNMNRAKLFKHPPETIGTSTITNNECKQVSKTLSFSVTNRLQKTWNIGSSIRAGIKTTFTGGVPGIFSGGIEISTDVSFQFSGGHTVIEESSYSTSVQITIPPNHYCSTRLVGYKYKTTIPFTAHISRTYSNGENTWVLITGTYEGVQVGDIQAVVDRCKSLPSAQSCSPKILR